MTKAEIIASLLDQARDKDALANGEGDSIFADDAQALREAAELLKSVPEWRAFCAWIETLPRAEFITGKRVDANG